MGVRLDSGDMIALSRQVRRILDEAGLPEVKIFASSGFDEYALARLIAGGARIDAFGVGTRMGVSADAPYLDMVYKMVRLGARNVRKVSEGKITLAGEKQVFRRTAADGRFGGDVIGMRAETVNGTTALLRPTMEKGRPVGPMPTLAEIRARFSKNFERLDHRHKRFRRCGTLSGSRSVSGWRKYRNSFRRRVQGIEGLFSGDLNQDYRISSTSDSLTYNPYNC
jgi:nicotinate phosphoribosyltransferase